MKRSWQSTAVLFSFPWWLPHFQSLTPLPSNLHFSIAARSRTVHSIPRPQAATSCSLSNHNGMEQDEAVKFGKSSAMFTTTNETLWQDVFPFEEGSHGSARIVVPPSTPLQSQQIDFDEESSLSTKVQSTITACKQLGKSSVWVHVPMNRCAFIEKGRFYEAGFRFHHAADDTVVLNLWLRSDCESKIPDYSTHHVGVGAVVVNSRDEILLVRELRRNYRPWKTPTGLSELGECLDRAVEREVLEETGIRAKFHSVLGFRQSHGMAFGRSDLFFVCRVDPIETIADNGHIIIPEPVAQASEIAVAAWIPLSEYCTMINGNPGHPMMSKIINVFESGRRIHKTIVESVVPGRKPNAVYFPVAPPP